MAALPYFVFDCFNGPWYGLVHRALNGRCKGRNHIWGIRTSAEPKTELLCLAFFHWPIFWHFNRLVHQGAATPLIPPVMQLLAAVGTHLSFCISSETVEDINLDEFSRLRRGVPGFLRGTGVICQRLSFETGKLRWLCPQTDQNSDCVLFLRKGTLHSTFFVCCPSAYYH